MPTHTEAALLTAAGAEIGLIGRRHAKPFSGDRSNPKPSSPFPTPQEGDGQTPSDPKDLSEKTDFNDDPPLEDSVRKSRARSTKASST